jgi:tetratricopeptide (TPR) repeat protein
LEALIVKAFSERKDEDKLRLFDRILDIHSSNTRAMIGKAIVFDFLERFDDALAMCRKAYAINCESLWILYENAWEAADHRNFVKAEFYLKRALSVDPENIATLLEFAYLHRRQSEFNEALSYVGKALEISPSDYKSMWERAFILGLMGKSRESELCFDMMLQIWPRDIDVMLHKVLGMINQKRNDEIIAICNQILAVDPQNNHALFTKYTTLQKLGRPAEADECYKNIEFEQGDIRIT